MLTQSQGNQIIEICQKLIQEQSYSGHEEGVSNTLKTIFRELGYDDVHVDALGNTIGEIRGSQEGPRILFDGHVDTVRVDSDRWQEDPFGAAIKSNRIYGRGTSDMKGAVAAMVAAAGFFARAINKDFPGTIYVACGVHEECFEGVASRQISSQFKPDLVVIGESTELGLNIGQKGRAELIVETFGNSAHSANPNKGNNAVYHMIKLVEGIRQLELAEHPELGTGILELTDIKSSPYPGSSVIPNHCRATYDRRLLAGETRESVLAPIQALIESLQKEDPKLDASVQYASGNERCFTGATIEAERFFPAWIYPDDAPFITAIHEGLQNDGLDGKIGTYSFCTNGSHYAGEANIKTIGFGPSLESMAHIDDEYIEISQLLGAAQGYYSILKTWREKANHMLK